MGWESLGRVRVTVRPRSVPAFVNMARNKVAAQRWGLATEVGLAPDEAFAVTAELERVLSISASSDRWSTALSADYLRWRTGFAPLNCRVMPLGQTLADGFVVFRIRQRGELRQLSLLHVVETPTSPPLRRTVGKLIASTKADLVMASGHRQGPVDGLVPVPNIGPIMTWRPLARTSGMTMDEMHLPLGVIELF